MAERLGARGVGDGAPNHTALEDEGRVPRKRYPPFIVPIATLGIMGDREPEKVYPWPFPTDSATQRARRVALAYREYLQSADPDLCAVADRRMLAFGQTWVVPVEPTFDEDAAITTREAALLVSVKEDTIRHWACMPHPTIPGTSLLPRHRRRGKHMTYLVAHVRAAALIMEHNRRQNTRYAA